MTYADEVLADSPASYLQLQGNATDSSPNHADGTVAGTITYSPGGPAGGQGASGWSAANYITIPTSAYAAGAFTLEAWAKTTYGSWAWILSLGSGGWFGASGALLDYSLGGGNDKNVSVSMNDGLWHHVAVTHDASNNLTLFKDGNQVATFAGIAAQAAGGTLTVGNRGGGTEPWQGSLAHVAIYKAAVSATRLKAHAQAGTLLSGSWGIVG